MTDPHENLNSITANFISHCEVLTLLALIEELARKLGVPDIDGKDFHTWFLDNRKSMIREKLLDLESTDPEFAAVLQDRIDVTLTRIGEQPIQNGE